MLSPAPSAARSGERGSELPPATGEGAEGLKAGRAGPRPSTSAISPRPGIERPGPEGDERRRRGGTVRLRRPLRDGRAVRPRVRKVVRPTERVTGRRQPPACGDGPRGPEKAGAARPALSRLSGAPAPARGSDRPACASAVGKDSCGRARKPERPGRLSASKLSPGFRVRLSKGGSGE